MAKIVVKWQYGQYRVYHVQRRSKPLDGMYFRTRYLKLFMRRNHARKFAKR